MKYYKVLKGNVGGFGNKTYKKGETVTDEMFPKGNAETLEKMEFLKATKAPKKSDEKAEKEAKEKAEKEAENTDSDSDENDSDELENGNPWDGKTFKDFSKDEIIGFLKSEKIDFNPIDNREKLFSQLS